MLIIHTTGGGEGREGGFTSSIQTGSVAPPSLSRLPHLHLNNEQQHIHEAGSVSGCFRARGASGGGASGGEHASLTPSEPNGRSSPGVQRRTLLWD